MQFFWKSLVEEDGLPDVSPVLVEALPEEEEDDEQDYEGEPAGGRDAYMTSALRVGTRK